MNNHSQISSQLKSIIKVLPHKPGVYQYYDVDGDILYVGKAKNLKKRVSSYFTKDQIGKVAVLVKKIADIKYIVVDTEMDALLLENNLIKKYQPRYNIMLKDDKTFPWIAIKNEDFPRVISTRNYIRDGSEYFGPYTSGKMKNTLLDLIRQLYQLRTCTYSLTQKNIESGKFKPCLEYQIGNCKAPCIGLQSKEDYDLSIQDIKHILKGHIQTVTTHLKEKMFELAEKFEFEKAQAIKEKLTILEAFQSKSTIVNSRLNNIDVYSLVSETKSAYSNYFKVVNGAIVQSHTIELKKKLDETDKELLVYAITEFKDRYKSDPEEILIPFPIDVDFPQIKMTIPQIGDKKKLLELSERNVKYYILEKKKRSDLVDPMRHTNRILEQMKKDLRMPVLPSHIECFDNSNYQGDHAVAACVVFRNAKPFKRDYRHYNIKTVVGPDDFASMKEVVLRRYKRLLDENKELPQLIIVDGGKGQLSAAVESLDELGLRGNITIIGIAKKLEEIYFPGDQLPLFINKKSETLKIIQLARNEAHRFGITHHRSKFEKEMTKTVLTEIEGIGLKTAQELLWKFKSVGAIKKASIKELIKAIGNSKGQLIFDHFSKKENRG